MTSLLLKLVGHNDDKNITIDKENITMTDIFSYLTDNNIFMNEISKIIFINNGKNITNDISTTFNGTNEYPLIIHIFTNNLEIKNKIIKNIFNLNVNINITKEYEDISKDEINANNLKLIELFSDNDFVYLLNIIKNKPNLLNKVSGYLTNGNIINNIVEINNDDFKYHNELIQLLELLNKLNKTYDENELKNIIQHFEGNLNLSLRYVLNK